LEHQTRCNNTIRTIKYNIHKISILFPKELGKLAVFLKPLEKSILKSGPPDNKKGIYINEIVKKNTFTLTGTR
jgi:hypothetical protein